MIKNSFLIYLAGPITGITYDGCTEWRDWVKENIDPSILTLSPMRGKQFIKERSRGGLIGMSFEDSTLASTKGINTRDYFDVQRCDALLVNMLGATRVSIGTVMEIAWARAFNKPVVLCMEKKGNVHDHAMLNYACGYIVDSLEEAIITLEAVLLPDIKIPQIA